MSGRNATYPNSDKSLVNVSSKTQDWHEYFAAAFEAYMGVAKANGQGLDASE